MKRSTTLLLLASTLFWVCPATAALNSYLTLTGADQGAILGEVTQEGREDTIMVVAFDFSPDSRTLTLTMADNRALPAFFTAHANAEVFADFELKLYRTNRAGLEDNHATIRLNNARITAIDLRQLDNKVEALMRFDHRASVTFQFESFQYTDNLNQASGP